MKLYALLLSSLLFFQLSLAQKPPIDHTVYDNWKNISSQHISNSGRLICYAVAAQEGDGYVELKNSKNLLLSRIERGDSPILTENEKFFITKVSPFFVQTKEARIKKKKTEEMPKDSIVVYSLDKKEKTNYGPVKNYKVAQKPKNHIAFIQEVTIPSPQKDTIVKKQEQDQKKGIVKPKTENALILLNLETRDTTRFWQVEQYYFSPNEKHLIFTKKYEKKDSLKTDYVNIYDIQNKKLKTISFTKGTYKEFTFDDLETQLVFLADKSSEKSLKKDFKIYQYNFQTDTATVLVDNHHKSIPERWHISGDASLRFSSKGQRLLLGLAPIPPIKDTSLVEFDHAVVDIWHWKEDVLMSQQLANLKRDLSKNYDALYDFSQHTLTPLIDNTFDRIIYTDSIDNEWAIASTSSGYRLEGQWQGYTQQKIFTVSLVDGRQNLVFDNFIGQYYLSPNGQYIVCYDAEKGQWKTHNITKGITRTLTENTATSFSDEQNDMPAFASSYGIAGWDTDGSGVYINDRYDIWYFGLNDADQYCLTNHIGRKDEIQFRILKTTRTKPRQRALLIDNTRPILLTSFNNKDKRKGLFILNKKKNLNPKEIVQNSFTHNNILSNEKLTTYIYTKENYQNCPDIYLSSDFRQELKVTDINPQQGLYNWGTAELMQWSTPRGFKAEGILYKPENFDPNKKYPVIAYFYETLTEGLYAYQAPAPTPSRLNIPYYVSNGYIVLAPDIRYEVGYPGRSAEEYVNSGMRHLSQKTWIDSTKMGIQGQSWGGYQVAHLITRTNMYAAAWAGAPVVNMTSAYGGIRWQTGMSRQFQYEYTQSRIGQNLWENRDLYIENSPLFFLDKVTTPVAIMSNDNDGAVPWYQGIEMFTALRRLGRQSWLLNYNKDGHNLMQRQNRKDIQNRQSQFFDHFLKGEKAPEWIKHGLKAENKGVDWAF